MNPRQQTIKQLSASGYELKRHGANHDIYYNPQTHSTVPVSYTHLTLPTICSV